MNKRWRFHFGEYDVAANETLYADMAAKGWMLEKRGAHLSRFTRATPEKLRFRIEYAVSAEDGLPEEQLQLYEDCGWKSVCGLGVLHVFCAPESSDIPELHTDPEQQAPILKRLRRRNRISSLVSFGVIALHLLIMWALSGESTVETAAEITLWFYRATTIVLFYLVMLVLLLFGSVRESIQLSRLYRRLKRGQSLDHSAKRRPPHRIIAAALSLLSLLLILATLLQLTTHRSWPPEDAPENPCLSFAELGLTGEPGRNPLNGSESRVSNTRTLLTVSWESREYLKTEDGSCTLYTDCYVLPSHSAAMRVAAALEETAVFADKEGFRQKSVDGLDYASCGALEYIAVRGDTVWYVTYLHPDGVGFMAPDDAVFAALAAQ